MNKVLFYFTITSDKTYNLQLLLNRHLHDYYFFVFDYKRALA